MEENKHIWIWVFIAMMFLSVFWTGGYSMMGMGFPFMILFWGGVIWLIYTLISPTNKQAEDPMTILKKRYALGELSKKQFDEMKKKLTR